MSEVELTDKQAWIFSHGFYGHWWDFPPYNTREYQQRFKKCMAGYYQVA
ncbi:unnamed protein product, partial [marine sediment metagenome]